MQPRIVPLYFDPGRDEGFDAQLELLGRLIGDRVEFTKPLALGQPLPDCDAVIFPQILGEAYRRLDDFKKIDKPILIVTSEFGTMSMWDWEIIDYLRSEGVSTIAPYSLKQTRQIAAAIGVRRQLRQTKFLVFQDNPGEGMQAPIFKRFYWWEDECTQRIAERFGVTIVKRSFKQLGKEAREISDAEADVAWAERQVHTTGLPQLAQRSAMKMYLAVRRHLDEDLDVRAVGINCLNESHFSDTTPCLAWNLLYEERKLIWGCEADTMSMLSKFILHHSLDAPILMTNLYPFLMGDAATKHEKIDAFPQIDAEPENHVLVAHCGYMGVIPKSFSTRWTLKPKVLGIVDDNAHAIDADIATGAITLAKLHASMDRMTVAQGELTGYAQFPGSDCVNGGIIRVRDGHKLMRSLASHHYLLMTGHHAPSIRLIVDLFNLTIDEI